MYAVLEGTGRIEVAVDMRDAIAWEDDRDRGFGDISNRLSDMAWLVWHAASRTGATTLDWEGWKAAVMEAGPVEAETGPTDPAQPGGG